MGSNNVSSLPALVKKVSSSNRKDRMDALETLRSIIDDFDDDGDLSEAMGSNELGLLPILVSIISSESGRARETALAILAGTSIYSSNNKYMLSLNLGLFPVLASLLSSASSYSIDRYYILNIVYNIHSAYGRRDNYHYSIGSKDVGVLSGLVIAIERNKSHRQFYHGYTLVILEDLVTGSENSLYMGSEDYLL